MAMPEDEHEMRKLLTNAIQRPTAAHLQESVDGAILVHKNDQTPRDRVYYTVELDIHESKHPLLNVKFWNCKILDGGISSMEESTVSGQTLCKSQMFVASRALMDTEFQQELHDKMREVGGQSLAKVHLHLPPSVEYFDVDGHLEDVSDDISLLKRAVKGMDGKLRPISQRLSAHLPERSLSLGILFGFSTICVMLAVVNHSRVALNEKIRRQHRRRMQLAQIERVTTVMNKRNPNQL